MMEAYVINTTKSRGGRIRETFGAAALTPAMSMIGVFEVRKESSKKRGQSDGDTVCDPTSSCRGALRPRDQGLNLTHVTLAKTASAQQRACRQQQQRGRLGEEKKVRGPLPQPGPREKTQLWKAPGHPSASLSRPVPVTVNKGDFGAAAGWQPSRDTPPSMLSGKVPL